MENTYEIKYEGVPIGTAHLEKQGLYLSFSCRCRLPQEGLYRIHVICGENREDLGICVPLGGDFGTDKRIPAKRFGEGTLPFELVPKDWKPPEVTAMKPDAPAKEEISVPEVVEEISPAEKFIPVSQEEPFEYLDKLENAHMEIHDGQPGIMIEQTMET